MKRIPLLLTLALLLLLFIFFPSQTISGKVKVWHHTSPKHYEKAKFTNVVLSDQGVVRLSRKLHLLADLGAMHIWDLAEDRKGNLYAATGDEGKLFRITPKGKVSVVFDSSDSQILCLTTGKDGAIYAGTGPTGNVVKIHPNGRARIIAENVGSYVWSLVENPGSNTLFAGTGPDGKIYEITPQGKVTAFYDTRKGHVLCLDRDEEGRLYAGTDKGGLVFRISPRGKGFVLYSAPQSEVRTLLVTANGVYAGTSTPGSRNGETRVVEGRRFTSSSLKGKSATPLTKASRPKGKGLKAVKVSRTSTAFATSQKKESKTKPAPSAPNPVAGENSLFRIASDGTVREIFRQKTMILSMLPGRGNLLIGTGMKGQLFQVDEQTRECIEVARLPNGQIHRLLTRKDGTVVLATGDPGKIFVLDKENAAEGSIVSDVLDAKILSKWGATTWRANLPDQTKISVAFRSGNVEVPDETWSDWSKEFFDPDGTTIPCPTARFLQYRVTLETNNPRQSPSLQTISLRYRTTNHAPEVTEITVPDLDGEDLEDPRKLEIKWKATDPNEDELSYDLFVRKKEWKSWVCLDRGITKTSYEWDAETMPTGWYQVKVVASDRENNNKNEALEAFRNSRSFPVSHVPPKVSVRVLRTAKKGAVVEAIGSDPLLRLTKAKYSLNGKDWKAVFPVDGLFDSKKETIRFQLQDLEPGNHVVVLRVQDAAGNVGVGDVVFAVGKQREQ